MREIKFRQKLPKGYGWHYWGFLEEGIFTGPDTGIMGVEQAQENSQEYTGLKDKNGREIYEGDRLNIRRYDRKTWEIGEVQFSNTILAYIVHCHWDDNNEADYYGIRFEEIREYEVI